MFHLATSASFDEVRAFLREYVRVTGFYPDKRSADCLFHWILPACQDGMTLGEIFACAGTRRDELQCDDTYVDPDFPVWDSILRLAWEMEYSVIIARS